MAAPLVVSFVDDEPVGWPSRLPAVPAWKSVMLRPLSEVMASPFASWTWTVIVDVCCEPTAMLVGFAVQPSFAAAPTGAVPGTVMRQKMP